MSIQEPVIPAKTKKFPLPPQRCLAPVSLPLCPPFPAAYSLLRRFPGSPVRVFGSISVSISASVYLPIAF